MTSFTYPNNTQPFIIMLIKDSDSNYFNWLKQHPTGYVANIERQFRPGYFVLHRATCHTINGTTHKDKPGAFTERSYVKYVANSLQELERWGIENSFDKHSFKFCKTCKVKS